MKTWYKYLILLTTILLTIVIALLLKDDEIDNRDFPEISESGVLRVVTDYNQIGYYASGDSVSGFNHDLLDEIQKMIPSIKIEISLENNLEKALIGLAEGRYDLIARNITTVESLKDTIAFTQALVRNKYVLLQRKIEYNDSIPPLRDHLALAHKTIYIPEGSPAAVRLQNLSQEIGDSIIIIEDPLYGETQLAMMVAKGEIDYSVCEIMTAEKLKNTLPEVDMLTDIGFTHLEAWAVRKSSPILLDSLNTWIDRLKVEKKYTKIKNKYYP